MFNVICTEVCGYKHFSQREREGDGERRAETERDGEGRRETSRDGDRRREKARKTGAKKELFVRERADDMAARELDCAAICGESRELVWRASQES